MLYRRLQAEILRVMVPVLVLVGLVLAAMPAGAQTATARTAAESPAVTAPLKVAVRQSPPFASKNADGEWQGLSVALWQTMAQDLGWQYEWVEVPLAKTIAAVADGTVDIAITSLSITAEREAIVEFSHPYYISGLARGYREGGSGWLAMLRAFVSMGFLSAVGSLLLVLLVAGALVWLFERKANPEQFGGGGVARGLGAGLWWSAVTMTTVGYGDKAPKTVGGRVVGLVWMFLSLIIVASFTAAIAASLTANRLANDGMRTKPISALVVATVEQSSAAAYVRHQGGRMLTYPSLPEAIRAVEHGTADVVVYDAPILKYWTQQEFDDIAVDNTRLIRDDYGFAIAKDSALREPINTEILKIIGSSDWRALKRQYFGNDDPF